MHTLTVRVDNILEKYSFPQIYADWFNYGGIARDVCLSKLYGISILNNHIVYTLSDDMKSVKVYAEPEISLYKTFVLYKNYKSTNFEVVR